MKLKYYLRGMGIGIILTAIVMGFALGGRKATLSDAEIIQRAKALGMVDGESGVLSNAQSEEAEETIDDKTASDTPLFEEGTALSEEEQQEVTTSDSSVSEMVKEEKAGENSSSQASTDSSIASTSSSKEETDSTTGKSDVASASNTSEAQEAGNASASAKTSDASAEASTSKTEESASAVATSSSGKGINTSAKTVTIPGGLGSDQVAQILYREVIIDNAISFNKYLVDSRKDRIIRSGTKTLPAGASFEQIASIITQ